MGDVPRLLSQNLAREHLEPCAFTLAAGTCLAITGRSGSGKSLLLRMIADLDPSEGEVWLDGNARSGMTGPAWRRQVTYCAAESGWWHPIVGTHFSNPFPTNIAQALGLPDSIFQQEVRLCSTGERQRLSLLRSLAMASPVLLLDEPTGALDAESVRQVETLLRARLQSGTSIIIVTHDLAQAGRLGNQHLIMTAGRLAPS